MKKIVKEEWRCQSNVLSETLLKKTKDIISFGSCHTGTVISRRMVIAIESGVAKASDPSKAFDSRRSKLFPVHNYAHFTLSVWKIFSCNPERILSTTTINRGY